MEKRDAYEHIRRELDLLASDLVGEIKKRNREKNLTPLMGIFLSVGFNFTVLSEVSLDAKAIVFTLIVGFCFLIRELIEVQCRILGHRLGQIMERLEEIPAKDSDW